MLEPMPETEEAMAEYLSFETTTLDQDFIGMGEIARRIVPDVVGLSLSLVKDGLTFTLIAPDVGIGSLDAVQYVDDGPCEAAVQRAELVQAEIEDLLDEGRWQFFAQAAAAAGVSSSLSMPILHEGEVTGGINIYASTPRAFDGHEERLAHALGASAEHAVRNADLSFSTRLRAVEAPAKLRDAETVDHAIGILSARFEEPIDEARSRLHTAAARAGVPVAVSARVIVSVHSAQG